MIVNDKETYEDLVSIIMPAYNCSDYIRETLESVLAQTYKNWELIIVDDCSTDNTAEIIKEYQERDTRIKYYKLSKNSGAAIARNKAIDVSKGKYMAFLDSDDIWFSEKLIKQIKFMKENKYDFTCTSYTKIDDKGNDLNRTIKAHSKLDYYGLLKNCPGNSTVIYNANKLGKFKIPDIRKRNDYVMWLSVIKKAGMLYGLEEALASHRIRKGSLSEKKVNLVRYHWKVYREIEKLSLIKSCFLIMYWIIVTVFKLR